MTTSFVKIAAGAVVCDGVLADGDITIGPDTVVFPGAKIFCRQGAGPIVIGRGCVVEEGASLENVDPGVMKIGEGNLFEVGCAVRAKQVGEYNVFQPKCEVGRGVTISSGICVGPTVRFDVAAKLEDNVSVFRMGGQPDEYTVQSRPRNMDTNQAKVRCYRTALSTQGKKYYLGKYNKLLPATATEAPA